MSGHCFQNLYYSGFKYNKKCLASVFSIVSSDVFHLFIYLFYFLQSTPNTTKTSHQTQILHKFTIHKFRQAHVLPTTTHIEHPSHANKSTLYMTRKSSQPTTKEDKNPKTQLGVGHGSQEY
jgi:hypothetical protein